MKKRKICVVTGSRAEYGLLYWLLREINEDQDLILQLVVTGAHLSQYHGETIDFIRKDGFKISRIVDLKLSDDSAVGITRSMGIGIAGFGKAFTELQPDLIVILGDRYEIMAAAEAAMISNIPIAHIHGGESTEGLIDEAVRHSITKMSHLHFVTAEPHRKRVIQLGEDPKRVFNYGAPGLDFVKRSKLFTKTELEKEIDFSLGDLSVLITYHPVTLTKEESIVGMRNILKAIKQIPNLRILFTKSNADHEGRVINKLIDQYVSQNSNAIAFVSMGQKKYLSALKNVNLVLGNSSSGIIEAPFLKTATINIGDRQRGRLKADSIIDCSNNAEQILKSIKKALSKEFQKKVLVVESLYGKGNASSKIKEKIKTFPLEDILMKKFYVLKGC